eukprot:14652346-Alexandrium_andersonii.AAC.1
MLAVLQAVIRVNQDPLARSRRRAPVLCPGPNREQRSQPVEAVVVVVVVVVRRFHDLGAAPSAGARKALQDCIFKFERRATEGPGISWLELLMAGEFEFG